MITESSATFIDRGWVLNYMVALQKRTKEKNRELKSVLKGHLVNDQHLLALLLANKAEEENFDKILGIFFRMNQVAASNSGQTVYSGPSNSAFCQGNGSVPASGNNNFSNSGQFDPNPLLSEIMEKF